MDEKRVVNNLKKTKDEILFEALEGFAFTDEAFELVKHALGMGCSDEAIRNPTISKGVLGPIHLAAFVGCLDTLDFLLGGVLEDASEINSSRIDLKGDNGMSALHIAADESHQDVVLYLMSRGADVNATNESGLTPLHLAAQHENMYEVVKILFLSGADASIVDCNGETALFAAVRSGNVEMVKILLENEVDSFTKNLTKESVIDIAQKEGCDDIVNFLELFYVAMDQIGLVLEQDEVSDDEICLELVEIFQFYENNGLPHEVALGNIKNFKLSSVLLDKIGSVSFDAYGDEFRSLRAYEDRRLAHEEEVKNDLSAGSEVLGSVTPNTRLELGSGGNTAMSLLKYLRKDSQIIENLVR